MIQKDEYRAGQGSRDIRGWSCSCKGCGFKSHVYKSRDTVKLIQEEHSKSCSVSGWGFSKVRALKPKAVPKARMPVWE